MQALIYTVMWGPVDPEVEELLAQETTVVRAAGESSRNIRPPCGYGLLQAKEEARKIQALRSLMRARITKLNIQNKVFFSGNMYLFFRPGDNYVMATT